MLITTEWNLAGMEDGQLDVVCVLNPSDEAAEVAMLTEWKKVTPDYFPCQFNSESLCNAVNEVHDRTGCRKDAALYTACCNLLLANGFLRRRGEDQSAAKMYKPQTRVWLG